MQCTVCRCVYGEFFLRSVADEGYLRGPGTEVTGERLDVVCASHRGRGARTVRVGVVSPPAREVLTIAVTQETQEDT
jgi:hypothetical protein